MNATADQTGGKGLAWLVVGVSTLVGLAAITRQSFWMDEGSSVFKALMPTLKEWWALTRRLGGSDIQMPLYMFLLWCWVKVGFISEFALRAINLPWFILGALSLRKVKFWPLVYLTSPFVIYYVGELRPYSMQIAAGCLAAAAFGKVLSAPDDEGFAGLHGLCSAALLLVASSLTGALWAAGLGLGLFVVRSAWLKKVGFWLRVTPWVIGGAAFAAYYVFTLLEGYQAAAMAGGGLLSVGFAGYELIGLLGLGPGKNELRGGVGAVMPFLPLLLPALLGIAVAWWIGVKQWMKESSKKEVISVAVVLTVPVILLLAVSIVKDFRILGRHVSPAVPVVLLPIALSLQSWNAERRVSAVAGLVAVVAMVASSLSVRFLERHARDDFRQASGLLFDYLEQRKSVWWRADMNSTRYYAYRKGGFPMVHAIQHLESDPVGSFLMADVVFLNRPEIRFPNGDHEKVLTQNSFKKVKTFTGFEVWESNY